jgi:hypothetical protein
MTGMAQLNRKFPGAGPTPDSAGGKTEGNAD